MKKNSILLTSLFLIYCNCIVLSQEDFTQFVNPLIGSDSSHELSNGNTYPAIALPWGMNFWTPQTGKMGDGWIYTHKNTGLVGLRQTHQPSPWINDYGAFSIMPITGKLRVLEVDRRSDFNNIEVLPHYYKVKLIDSKTTVELTPTKRSAHFKIEFPKNVESHLIIDAFFKNSTIKVLPDENKIIGISKNNSGGVPENFSNYFIIEFNTPFDEFGTWDGKGKIFSEKELTGEHVGSYVSFLNKDNTVVEARISSSFISHEQAQINLNREIPSSQSFEKTKELAKMSWNNELSKIKIKPAIDQSYNKEGYFKAHEIAKSNVIKFYSSFYRTLLFPREFHEYNSKGEQVHYSPYNGKIEKGPLYTDNGFWDTFRAVFPFYTLMYPEKLGEILQGIMVNPYKESGWLPEWSSPGHRDCMIGSNSASIIAEAYLKGITNFDIETAYEGILNSSKNEGPLSSVGRKGVKEYNSLGYIPFDTSINESVARTLEYAYNDYCIWKLAEKLDRPEEEVALFKNRSFNYKNVFDVSTNFMRGKSSNGDFENPFSPDKWGGVFTEGSAWHYTWSVLHDPQGLINLMGGRENYVRKMDQIFTSDPSSDYSYYGFKIHEILEMELGGMGQYAHGNQPVQHAIYLYNYAQEPWKTQEKVRYVMDNLYGPGADGYCGDEDNGQTSAWFVFSSLGFYPVAPVTGQYVIGSPLFEEVTIELSNGKELKINAKNNSAKNVFIKEFKLNQLNSNNNWIDHADLRKGGVIDFNMSNKPNLNWGSEKKSVPYSMSNEE
ncbi:MAG: GH92 family glycosyl hydrolase [Flavobacteriales bacterium]|tara:strand:- start:189 stop:2519 length:2331 start_codon:yes stop_codon:yes gene_type:complete